VIAIQDILCPVDLSPVSHHAFEHAAAIAGWYGARVHVLHVYTVLIPATVPPFAFAGPLPNAPSEPDLAGVHDDLARLVAPAKAAGIEVDVDVVDGIPAQRIGEQARQLAADLIVMGTHGHNRLERFLLGSVTERVLRTNSAALLTVPPPCADIPSARFSNILCCVDFCESSLAAVTFALSLAQEAGGRIALLHVVDWPDEDEPLTSSSFDVPEYRLERKRDAQIRLDGLVPAHVRDWCQPSTMVRLGRPYRAILRVASEIGADLVVIGSHGHGPLERLFVGSTANHIVRSASCPVLTMGRA
jgi:nucleotide-binding universal stress UspA family protein